MPLVPETNALSGELRAHGAVLSLATSRAGRATLVPMRLPKLWPALLAIAAIGGCDVSSPVGPPSPDQVALRAGDVPGALKSCPGSGSIDSYLKSTRTRDPDSYANLSDAWAALQSAGAKAAAITAYSDDLSNCSGVLGAGRGRSASSFVIRYHDDGAAVTAFKKGILKFPNPGAGQQTPGLTVGAGTGLGGNSWVFDQAVQGRSAYVAFWQRGSFDMLVLAADLDAADAKRAVESVDSRSR